MDGRERIGGAEPSTRAPERDKWRENRTMDQGVEGQNARNRGGGPRRGSPMLKLVFTGVSITKNDFQALNVKVSYANPRENRVLGGLGFRMATEPVSGQMAP
jgi:hypothetical protein